MTQEILKALSVLFSSSLKFIFGPIEGYLEHLHFVTTFLCTVGGMMLSVIVFTYFGDWIRKRIIHRFFPIKEGEEKPHTKFRDFIIKHGLEGIAFLTPLFLTPIGGTILAVSMGNPKGKIIFYMLVSALGWALVFTSMMYSVGPSLIHLLKKLDIFNY